VERERRYGQLEHNGLVEKPSTLLDFLFEAQLEFPKAENT
jgi:hypothetical protein